MDTEQQIGKLVARHSKINLMVMRKLPIAFPSQLKHTTVFRGSVSCVINQENKYLLHVYLGVTTVLTMTTLMASVNAALPKISYMKSIDIYLGVCFFMVFGALIGKMQIKPHFISQS